MRPEGGAVVWLPRCHLAVWSLTLPSGLLPPREGHLAPFLLVSSILPTFLYFCISPPFFLAHSLLSPSHLSFLSLIQSTDNNHCTCSHTKIAHLSELQRDWRHGNSVSGGMVQRIVFGFQELHGHSYLKFTPIPWR